MNKREEDFIFFYMEQTWTEMRHLETLRERVSILIITLSTGIAGFIIQQKFASNTRILIWIIIFLGVFGIFMTLKIYQIHQRGQKRLNKWYEYIESKCGENPMILKLKEQADIENKSDFNLVYKIPHNFFWTGFFLFIILGGISLFLIKPAQEIQSKNSLNFNLTLKYENTIDTLKIEKDTLIIKTIK